MNPWSVCLLVSFLPVHYSSPLYFTLVPASSLQVHSDPSWLWQIFATCHLVYSVCFDSLAVNVPHSRPIVYELFKLDQDQYQWLLCIIIFNFSTWTEESLNLSELLLEEYKWLIYPSIPGLITLPSLQPFVLRPLSSADWISSAPITMLLSPSPLRIRPCGSQHRGREDILYGLCTSGHPPDFGHVPECWWAHQHLCQISASPVEKVPWNEAHRSIHGQHADYRFHILHMHAVHRGTGLLPLWRMEFFPCLLLLFHHTHHHWLWGLCGPAERTSSADQAQIRGLQLHLHPHGTGCDRRLPQLGSAALYDHERWRREAGRWAEGTARSQWPGRRPHPLFYRPDLVALHATRMRRGKHSGWKRRRGSEPRAAQRLRWGAPLPIYVLLPLVQEQREAAVLHTHDHPARPLHLGHIHGAGGGFFQPSAL